MGFINNYPIMTPKQYESVERIDERFQEKRPILSTVKRGSEEEDLLQIL
jgi:hypothetical protein